MLTATNSASRSAGEKLTTVRKAAGEGGVTIVTPIGARVNAEGGHVPKNGDGGETSPYVCLTLELRRQLVVGSGAQPS